MGAEHPKPVRKMNKVDLEIVCQKVNQYLMLHRGRKIDELALKERAVKEKLQNQKRLYGDCLFDISSIVTLLNWILASKIVMRNVQFIKERSMQIVSAANERNSDKIAPLIKYIQSVIWAAERLNLNQIKEFTHIIGAYFGQEFIRLAKEGVGVDPELANCFRFVEPTKPQVGDYLIKMLKRYGFTQIDIEKELPPAYRQPNDQQAPPPPSPAQNRNQDQKFNYGNQPSNSGGGFFDNPSNMAGQSNWGKFLNPNFMNQNNVNVNPSQMGGVGPNHFNNPGNVNPQSNNVKNAPDTDVPNDFDDMINDLQQKSMVKDGNELINPSMSQMKLGSNTKHPKPPQDDFEDLLKSLQGNVNANQTTEQTKPPKMRGPPKRRNKATKPVSNEPEAYQYTNEVDADTEDKRYEDLSLEYRLEEMRKLRV